MLHALKTIFASIIVLGLFYGGMTLEKRLAQGQIVGTSAGIDYLSDQFTSLGAYVTPLEGLFIYSSEMNFPSASIADFELGTATSGGAGNTIGAGFGNDDGAIVVNTGTAGSGQYRSVFIQANSATARSLVLSTTPQRFKIQVNTDGALTNKTLVVGLGDSTTIDTAYQAAGAADAVMFRIVAAGAGVNWFAVTKNGASETTTDTGTVDVLGAEVTMEIVATSAQIVYGFCATANCEPTVVATHTTNIPNDALIPLYGALTSDTVNKVARAFWWKYLAARITP